jgi:hypothetical protein
MNGQAGKGDSPRPIADRKKWAKNWERAFGKKIKAGKRRRRSCVFIPMGIRFIWKHA